MSNLDNLTQKIVDDARIKADEIIKEATKEKENVISSKIDQAEKEAQKLIIRAKEDAQPLKNRKLSNAQLQVRDQILRSKRQIISSVIKEAKNRLDNLEEKEYVEFLDNKIKDLKLKGDEILVVQEGMEKALKPARKYPKIAKDEYVESGFVIIDENITMNFTFRALIDYKREELESELVAILFDEGE